MSDWVGILASRGEELREEPPEDGRNVEEDVLSQVIYEAIAHFMEHDNFRLWNDLADNDFDYDSAIIEWVNAQGVT